MKYLNNLLGISILCLCIFTSCSEEAINDLPTPTVQTVSAIESGATNQESTVILIPESVAYDIDKTLEYINSLSEEEYAQHVLTYKIIQFLRATGNLEKFYEENPNYTLLTMDDLQKYAPKVLDEFQDFDLAASDMVTPRGCHTTSPYCDGPDLIQNIICCDFWIWGCEYAGFVSSPNHSQCYNPCDDVQCGPNQYCDNGYCYDYDDPVECDPPCDPGQTCIGFRCID